MEAGARPCNCKLPIRKDARKTSWPGGARRRGGRGTAPRRAAVAIAVGPWPGDVRGHEKFQVCVHMRMRERSAPGYSWRRMRMRIHTASACARAPFPPFSRWARRCAPSFDVVQPIRRASLEFPRCGLRVQACGGVAGLQGRAGRGGKDLEVRAGGRGSTCDRSNLERGAPRSEIAGVAARSLARITCA